STLKGVDARASVRAPERDVPPELEAICVKATALEGKDRYPSAREISDAIERFLDGDRDLAMRKDAAERHLVRAEQALARAVSGDAITEHSDRGEAFRELSHALALDPS